MLLGKTARPLEKTHQQYSVRRNLSILEAACLFEDTVMVRQSRELIVGKSQFQDQKRFISGMQSSHFFFIGRIARTHNEK